MRRILSAGTLRPLKRSSSRVEDVTLLCPTPTRLEVGGSSTKEFRDISLPGGVEGEELRCESPTEVPVLPFPPSEGKPTRARRSFAGKILRRLSLASSSSRNVERTCSPGSDAQCSIPLASRRCASSASSAPHDVRKIPRPVSEPSGSRRRPMRKSRSSSRVANFAEPPVQSPAEDISLPSQPTVVPAPRRLGFTSADTSSSVVELGPWRPGRHCLASVTASKPLTEERGAALEPWSLCRRSNWERNDPWESNVVWPSVGSRAGTFKFSSPRRREARSASACPAELPSLGNLSGRCERPKSLTRTVAKTDLLSQATCATKAEPRPEPTSDTHPWRPLPTCLSPPVEVAPDTALGSFLKGLPDLEETLAAGLSFDSREVSSSRVKSVARRAQGDLTCDGLASHSTSELTLDQPTFETAFTVTGSAREKTPPPVRDEADLVRRPLSVPPSLETDVEEDGALASFLMDIPPLEIGSGGTSTRAAPGARMPFAHKEQTSQRLALETKCEIAADAAVAGLWPASPVLPMSSPACGARQRSLRSLIGASSSSRSLWGRSTEFGLADTSTSRSSLSHMRSSSDLRLSHSMESLREAQHQLVSEMFAPEGDEGQAWRPMPGHETKSASFALCPEVEFEEPQPGLVPLNGLLAGMPMPMSPRRRRARRRADGT